MEPLLYTLMRYLHEGLPYQREEARRILCEQADLIEHQWQQELAKWDKITPGLQLIRDAQADLKKELDQQAELNLTSNN